MRRNQNYWLKDDAGNSLPYLDEIVHVLVPDLETELEKFLAGESDVHGVLGEEYARLEPLQEEGGFTIFRRGPAFGTTFLGFNMNPGEDTGHRRALRHSLEAQVVPEHPVPPGRGAHHRQGHDHRRRAARPRLPAVGIRKPRRRPTSTTQTFEGTNTTWTRPTKSSTASDGRTLTGTGSARTTRATTSSFLW